MRSRRADGRASRRRADGRANVQSGLRVGVWLPALVGLGCAVLAWQLLAVNEPYGIVPTVPATLAVLGDQTSLLWRDTLTTLREVAVGAAASFLCAFLLAVAMVHVKALERALMPLAVIMNVTPVIAYATSLVIFFSATSVVPRYIVTAVIVFFAFLVNALVGLRAVDPEAHDVLRTLHASRWEVLWRLRLPSSLPYLFAAARICLPLAITGAVVAEFTTSGSEGGLGSFIYAANIYSNSAQEYAAILVLAALGLLLTGIVVLVERRLLSWHPAGGRAR